MGDRKYKPLEELTLMDDYMFGVVMNDLQNLKPLLEYILEIEISEIAFAEPQRTMKEGYDSHGIRLDLYVKDNQERIFNVEVQTNKKKHLPKRMRYYQSVIDINVLSPGVDYSKLEKSFIIFICDHDPFGQKRYLYTFENRCREMPWITFGDETIKVVVNTKGAIGNISNELKKFLLYLDSGVADSDYTKQLDHVVRQVKVSEKRRREYMLMMVRENELREEGRAEGREEGRAEGRKEGRAEERKNTERERNRADTAERELAEMKARVAELEAQMA